MFKKTYVKTALHFIDPNAAPSSSSTGICNSMALAEAGLELEELEAEAMAAPETGKRQLMGPWNPAITH